MRAVSVRSFHGEHSVRVRRSKEDSMKDEPYIRSTDGARMIPIAPGEFVNEAVWKKLAKIH
jgi:hypothetical protein